MTEPTENIEFTPADYVPVVPVDVVVPVTTHDPLAEAQRKLDAGEELTGVDVALLENSSNDAD